MDWWRARCLPLSTQLRAHPFAAHSARPLLDFNPTRHPAFHPPCFAHLNRPSDAAALGYVGRAAAIRCRDPGVVLRPAGGQWRCDETLRLGSWRSLAQGKTGLGGARGGAFVMHGTKAKAEALTTACLSGRRDLHSPQTSQGRRERILGRHGLQSADRYPRRQPWQGIPATCGKPAWMLDFLYVAGSSASRSSKRRQAQTSTEKPSHVDPRVDPTAILTFFACGPNQTRMQPGSGAMWTQSDPHPR